MPSRRRLVILLGMAPLAPLAARAQADNVQAASGYIAALLDEGFKALIGRDIAEPERARRFRDFLKRHIEMPGLPQGVLGRYWDRMTPAQRDEYLSLFQEYLVVAYAGQLALYPPEGRVGVVGAQAVDGRVVVSSESVEPGAAPVRIDWFVARGPDGLRVTDVIAAGISARETLRADFTGVIRGNGGQVEALLAALRKKVAAN